MAWWRMRSSTSSRVTWIFSCSAMRCRMKLVFRRCAASAARHSNQLLLPSPSAFRRARRVRDCDARVRSERGAFRVFKRFGGRSKLMCSLRNLTTCDSLGPLELVILSRARSGARACAADQASVLSGINFAANASSSGGRTLCLISFSVTAYSAVLPANFRDRKIRREIPP